MPEHTPTPWTVDPLDPHRVIGPNGVTVALCGPGGVLGAQSYAINKKEAAANARLVAQASEIVAKAGLAASTPSLVVDAESICPICERMAVLRSGPGGDWCLSCEVPHPNRAKGVPSHVITTGWLPSLDKCRERWEMVCGAAGGTR